MCLLTGVDLTVHTCIFLSVGAPPAIMGTLERRVAPARGVTAARVAPCTGIVTAGPGSASADQAPRGSDARNANRGTFYWKAIVFVGILLLSVFKEFSLSVVFLLRHQRDKGNVSANCLRIGQARL